MKKLIDAITKILLDNGIGEQDTESIVIRVKNVIGTIYDDIDIEKIYKRIDERIFQLFDSGTGFIISTQVNAAIYDWLVEWSKTRIEVPKTNSDAENIIKHVIAICEDVQDENDFGNQVKVQDAFVSIVGLLKSIRVKKPTERNCDKYRTSQELADAFYKEYYLKINEASNLFAEWVLQEVTK